MGTSHKTVVSWTISPINALQTLAAFKTYKSHLKENLSLILFCHHPSSDPILSKETFQVIQSITKDNQENARCVFIDQQAAKTKDLIHEIITAKDVHSIFYAHDVVGNFLNALKEAYPDIETVCYGDALGQFFEKDVHLGFLKNSKTSFLHFLKKKIFKTKNAQQRHPDYAILSIPVSQAKFPSKTTLLIPNQTDVRKVFEKQADACKALTEYCQALVGQHEGKKYLFTCENCAEGNFIDIDGEIDMYSNIITEQCETGATIFLKMHPGETFPRFEKMQEKLSKHYKCIKIKDEFKRYPIELFLPLLKNTTVMSMYYPALSLKYLYDINVVQTLNDKKIEEYFDPKFWRSYKNSIDLNMIPLKRLKNWDGKKLLYNGK